MKLTPKLWLALALTLWSGVRAHSQDMSGGEFQAGVGDYATVSSSIILASPSVTSSNHERVTRYATRFAGDHSLEEATVVEQAFARYTRYTVWLQFASGAEQFVVVTAPPGGLQLEMRDMNGDRVPNDLVLTTKLLRLPLIVLLNEGHDHLAVAISPGSFTTGEGRASGPHQVYLASALATPGLKRGGHANSGDLHFPQLEEKLLAPPAQVLTKRADCSSASGRAPPALATAL